MRINTRYPEFNILFKPDSFIYNDTTVDWMRFKVFYGTFTNVFMGDLEQFSSKIRLVFLREV